MFNPIQIEYFMALAKYENFTTAAEKLYVSQPAISKQISMLEQEVGTELFFRQRGAVVLSEAGKILYKAFVSMQDIYNAALRDAKQFNEPISCVNIGLAENSVFGNLNDILTGFFCAHPEFRCDISNFSVWDIAQSPDASKYDILITPEFALLNNSDYTYFPIVETLHLACFSKSHPLASKPGLQVSDFKNEVQFSTTFNSQNVFGRDYGMYICAVNRFIPAHVRPVRNIPSMLLAISTGTGFGIIDQSIVIPPDLNLATISTNVTSRVIVAWHKNNTNRIIPLLTEAIKENISFDGSK